jgi:hypothetical protein
MAPSTAEVVPVHNRGVIDVARRYAQDPQGSLQTLLVQAREPSAALTKLWLDMSRRTRAMPRRIHSRPWGVWFHASNLSGQPRRLWPLWSGLLARFNR